MSSKRLLEVLRIQNKHGSKNTRTSDFPTTGFNNRLPSFTPSEATLANTHSARNVSLGHNTNTKTNHLLHPLSNPFARVNAAIVYNLLDLSRHLRLLARSLRRGRCI